MYLKRKRGRTSSKGKTCKALRKFFKNNHLKVGIAAIVLLSLVQVWTNLETHWLHTLLFVACVVYSFSRAKGKRRMVVLANTRSTESATRRARVMRVIDV